MGFFSDLKEDLSQAVNELIPEDEQIKTGETEKSELSLDEMLKNIDEYQIPEGLSEGLTEETAMAEPEAGETAEENQTADTDEKEMPEAEFSSEVAAGTEENDTDEEMTKLLEQILDETPIEPEEVSKGAESIQEDKGVERKMDMDRVASDETSVITNGMTIIGDITTEGSIDVIGKVNGNIEALGKLNITGHINGNSKAAEIYAESAKINGEIVSLGAVKIGASAVIIGNITAASAAIAGAVKGDIDVHGPVILDASAIVMGNIKSKSVQINNGAVIEGMCSQCYADISPTSFFDDYKPENRKAKTK